MVPQPTVPRENTNLPYGGRLMFTQSWEDPACDQRALRVRPGETVFAISSGGDNVLEFLLYDPARVVAVDLNPTQTYLLELKIAALRQLSHSEMLHFLGVRSPAAAADAYQKVCVDLSHDARSYWDGRRDWREPLLTLGGFERYFALLRTVLHYVIGRRRMEKLFTLEPAEQKGFYQDVWNGVRWRMFMRIACSKTVLGNRLDPSWFAHADSPNAFGIHFAALAAHAIGTIPARTNYFLAQIFLGRYLDEMQVPAYLRSENQSIMGPRLDRLDVRTRDVADALAELPDTSVDAFALSNVFEYSDVALFERCKREICRVARPGARICLRNLLAPRRLGDDARFVVDRALSEELRAADRAFIYSRFEAATVAASR